MKTKLTKTKRARVQSPIRVGNKVFIRSVTHHYTGQIVMVTKDEIVLKEAAWIADDGRFMQAMKDGVLNEVEPYPDNVLVAVGRGASCDVSDWLHALPRVQK